jgi:YfiH family protein
MLTARPLEEIEGVRHAFLTREGGVSGGIYASLNCGYGSGDDAASVTANRRRAVAAGAPEAATLVTLYQVHGPRAIAVDAPWPAGKAPRADAMVTARADVALGILSADCAPVLLADPVARVIGAAHAGWRGALAGVLEATVAAMERLGAERGRIAAAIGPCIQLSSYEVGPEFPKPFLDEDPANARFFRPADRPGRQGFDLSGYCAAKLAAEGLAAVAGLPNDTCAEADLFFSYRRAARNGEPDYGRGLSLICLEG